MSRADLQALVASPAQPAMAAPLCLGDSGVDARLRGGLAVAACHELYAAAEGDDAAVAATALLFALRSGRPGPVIWLREDKARRQGRLYGRGLAELGFDPARLLLIEAPDTLAVLRAAAEAIACAAVAAVIVEPWGKAMALDLTATRRLSLAAARSGVCTLLLRSGEPRPSAAASRWRVGAAPSRALPASAPGPPVFDLALLRHRGGVAGFETRLEWNRDRQCFENQDLAGVAARGRARGAALHPGGVPAAAAERTAAPAARRRAA